MLSSPLLPLQVGFSLLCHQGLLLAVAAGTAACWPRCLQCHPALNGRRLVGKYQRQTWPQQGQSKTFTAVFITVISPPSNIEITTLVENQPEKCPRLVPMAARGCRLPQPPGRWSPLSTAPWPTAGQHICNPSARPCQQLGICFFLFEPTSGRAAAGQSQCGAVLLLFGCSGRAGSLALPRNLLPHASPLAKAAAAGACPPPAQGAGTWAAPPPFAGSGELPSPFGECPPWGKPGWEWGCGLGKPSGGALWRAGGKSRTVKCLSSPAA